MSNILFGLLLKEPLSTEYKGSVFFLDSIHQKLYLTQINTYWRKSDIQTYVARIFLLLAETQISGITQSGNYVSMTV